MSIRLHVPALRLAAALALVRLWSRVGRERRALADLPPELLADIGITPAEAASECRRAAWDIGGGRAAAALEGLPRSRFYRLAARQWSGPRRTDLHRPRPAGAFDERPA